MQRAATAGFTLVELLVTIAILGILLAIGLPSFQDSIRSNRMATASNEMIAALSLARTEAVRTTRGGGVCGSNAAGTGCVSSTTWNEGMLVWADANATQGYDAGDTLVRRVAGGNDVSVNVPANGTSDTRYQVLFNRMGMVAGTAGPARVITLSPTTCPSGRDLKRTLTMTSVGQVRLDKDNCP